MMDLQDTLQTIIEANWTETNPCSTIIDDCIRFDEFDPKFGSIKAGAAICPTSELQECTWDACQEKWICNTHGGIDCHILDPAIGGIQIVIEDFPSRRTYLCEVSTGRLYRIEHACRITVYLKPMKFDLTSVASAKVVFRNIKTELDRIFALKKFSTTGVSNLDMSSQGWNDRRTLAVGRGIKRIDEPIIWESETIVVATYYIVG